MPNNDQEMPSNSSYSASTMSSGDTITSRPHVVPQVNLPSLSVQQLGGIPQATAEDIIINPLAESAPRYKESTCSDKKDENKIGEGSFGSVYKVFHAIIGIAALKVFNSSYSEFSPYPGMEPTREQAEKYRKRRREFDIIFRCNHHPNTVSFFGFIYDSDPERPTGILMEYMKGGNIHQYIIDNLQDPASYPLDLYLQNTWTKHIALGINFMHSRDIMHRDIKPNNIMLTAHLVAKVGDFGLGKVIEEGNHQHTQKIGNLVYTAPEVFLDPNYTKYVDSYSYGMTLYYIFYKQHPFDEQKLRKMSRFTASQKIRGTDGQLPWRPDLGSFPIDDLIQKCWVSEHADRLSFPRIVQKLYGPKGMEKYPSYDM